MKQRLFAPGVALLVLGILGILLALTDLAMQVFMDPDAYQSMFDRLLPPDAPPEMREQFKILGPMMAASRATSIVVDLLGIAGAGFIAFAGTQLIGARSRTVPMVAAILAMIPCVNPSCCCLAGIPVGIWVIMTLNKPEVVAYFSSGSKG